MDWDESVDIGGEYGPYRQIRTYGNLSKIYGRTSYKGLAYKCYCTEEELEAEREEQMAQR